MSARREGTAVSVAADCAVDDLASSAGQSRRSSLAARYDQGIGTELTTRAGASGLPKNNRPCSERAACFIVMAGLAPAIHVFAASTKRRRAWPAGACPREGL